MKEQRNRQRRESVRERRSDAFDPAVKGVKRQEIESVLAVKDSRIEIRCPSVVKDDIEETAGRFGLTVTTYFMRLHALVKSKLTEGKDK